MGLSASQARLLSITARLTDNELHSQLITQAKIRLASESASASNEYIDSLSQTKLQMATYDSNGTATYSDLTANYLSTYQPLKNQYSITNASGQNLETSSDIANYESTDSLYNFLDNYGLIANSDDLDTYNKALKNYNDVLLPEYEAQLVIYNQEYEVYKTDKAEYDAEWKAYDEKLAAYNKELQKPDVYSAFVNVVGTSSAPKSCYANAFGGSMGCYEHVLAHLLDFDNDSSTYGKTYDTSVSGLQSTTNWSLISGSAINSDGKSPAFVDVSKEICSADTVNTHYCDGDDDFNTDGKQNLIKQRLDAGGSFDLTSLSDQLILLRSDYIYDSATNSLVTTVDDTGATVPAKKTLKQKAIDLLYILQHQGDFGIDNNALLETLKNFTDGDMKNLIPDKPEEPTIEKPIAPTPVVKPEKPTYKAELTDQEKGQWYVNLWYQMNGSKTANKVKTSTDTDGNSIYTVEAADKNTDENDKNYKAIDETLASSSDWLKYALENGIVTLKKTQVEDSAETSGSKAEITSVGITWKNIIYTSASDMKETEDTTAQTKAEAKYQKATTEIEAKDKQYDSKLKNLDTIHSALQTEYESVKTVISKNVERSFKTFTS